MVSSTPKEDANKADLSVTATAPRYDDEGQRGPAPERLVTQANEKTGAVPRVSDISTPASTHSPFDTDIEAMLTTESRNARSSRECTKGGTDCQVWPSRDHWRRKAKLAKKKRRNCTCLGHLSKRNRIIAKILIGALVIGIAVAVGFGVSKPLGAGIWKSGD